MFGQVPVHMARYTFDLKDGAYTCLATLPGMSAFFDKVSQFRDMSAFVCIAMACFSA